MELVKARVFLNANGKATVRPTTRDKDGMPVVIHHEQYRRSGITHDPDGWGLKNANTGRLSRVMGSRAEARKMRKDNERVVAIWFE